MSDRIPKPPREDRLYEAPLVVRKADDGTPAVSLGGMDLSFLLGADGLRIWTDTDAGIPEFVVEMTFAPGALELDFDVDLLRSLLEQAEAKAAAR